MLGVQPEVLKKSLRGAEGVKPDKINGNLMVSVKTDLIKAYFDAFYKLTDAEFQRFSERVRPVDFKAREKITREGDVENHVYFVVKGIVRKYFRNGDHEIATGFFAENQICHASISYFTGSPSKVILEAIEPSTLLMIHRNDLEILLNEIPGLEKIFRAVIAQLYIRKDQEKMQSLVLSKKERFLDFCEKNPELLQRVPQKQLASYLDIQPETFCRMKQLRYKLAREARASEHQN